MLLPHIPRALLFTHSLKSTWQQVAALVDLRCYKFNSEAHMPPFRTGPEQLFPFTRNVPCGRRNQAKTSSCSSGFISLFKFNSEAHMLLPHIPGPSVHTFLEVMATNLVDLRC